MRAISNRIERHFGFITPIVWQNVIGMTILQLAGLYTALVLMPFKTQWTTLIVGWCWAQGGGLATTVGAHRLWTHKTYKAKLPLRIFIMFWYLSSGQYSMVQWVKDHRTHHKFADTNADPHNARRGFWFCHMGWLMMKRHPELKEKGKLIDVSDVLEDPVVRFQQKYFVPLFIFCFLIAPFYLSYYILQEPLSNTIIGFIFGRYILTLNSIWCVNSVAHLWGYKPYNKNIMAVQTKVGAFFTLGEAWHNFHHTFPWDYRIGELGQGFQMGTYFIDLFAWLGLAYDLKTASPELIKKVVAKAKDMKPNEEVPYEEFDENGNPVEGKELKKVKAG